MALVDKVEELVDLILTYELITLRCFLLYEMILILFHHLTACFSKCWTKSHQKIDLSVGRLQLSLGDDLFVDEGRDLDDLCIGLFSGGEIV